MHFSHSLTEFSENYQKQKPFLTYGVLSADLYTPVAVALLFANEEYIGLFESVEGGKNRGRYSFITIEPDLVFSVENSAQNHKDNQSSNTKLKTTNLDTGVVDVVEGKYEQVLEELRLFINSAKMDIPSNLPPMAFGVFGYMGYEMVQYMEKIELNQLSNLHIPSGIFMRPKIVIVFDAVKDEMFIITPVFPGEKSAEIAYKEAQDRLSKIYIRITGGGTSKDTGIEGMNMRTGLRKTPSCTNGLDGMDTDGINIRKRAQPPSCFLVAKEHINSNLPIYSNTSHEQYCQMVQKAKQYILDGDIFQVVLAQRFMLQYKRTAFDFYRSLRRLNPSPFSFLVKFSDFTLVGSSPEILVRLKNNIVTSRPIAGTRKRGKDASEDQKLAEDLLSDDKELSEHLMLIDLGRNDVGRISKIGSVKVTEKMVIEQYSHVMHIVSNIEALKRDELDALDVVCACFPVGTVSGAPKIRAMQIIDELEHGARDFYAGGVGYFSASGDVDMCITLRTALIKDDILYIQSGGGVVEGSSAEGEYQESCNKASALIKAAEFNKN